MAKKKKKRGKQGLFSKAINIGLILLGFSTPLRILFGSTLDIGSKVDKIIRGATFGLSAGSFNLQSGLKMYTPAGGALALGALKSFLMRKFPVRG